MMRRLVLGLALWGMGTPVIAAELPVEGNVGVLYKPLNPVLAGMEAELGPRGGAWHVGGLFQVQIWETQTGNSSQGYTWDIPQIATVWGRYDWTLPNGDAFGGIVGLTYSPTTQWIGQPVSDRWSAVGPLLGLSYLLRSGPLWARATPHVVFAAHRLEGDWLTRSGLPWLEVGWVIVPGLQVSARFTEAFFKLSWVY
jgi:hypothetical protein